jgi:hypothetical protein
VSKDYISLLGNYFEIPFESAEHDASEEIALSMLGSQILLGFSGLFTQF